MELDSINYHIDEVVELANHDIHLHENLPTEDSNRVEKPVEVVITKGA